MPQGGIYNGAVIWQPITDVQQFIQTFYASSTLPHLQKAKIVASQDLPKIAAQVAQINGLPSAKAGRVRYEYQI